jgi:hypothetical protein
MTLPSVDDFIEPSAIARLAPPANSWLGQEMRIKAGSG